MCAAIGGSGGSVGGLIGPKERVPSVSAGTMQLPELHATNPQGPTGGDAIGRPVGGGPPVDTPDAPAGQTDLGGMIRKKKLAAMRAGILSTVMTPAGGPQTQPSLSTPAAGGLKSKLGQ